MPDQHPLRSGTFAPFTEVDLDLPGRRDGKVRVSWELPQQRRLMVTTDRLSAFDRILAGVPYKGQVLNQLSAWWFNNTDDIVPNHLVSLPDPNAMVVTSASPLPIEVVVRGHITGVTDTSIWGMYEAGQREVYGHQLPDGLRKNDQLPTPIITPTTKAADGGHDHPISVDEVASYGLLDPVLWQQVQEVALALFERGRVLGERAQLMLADTKYEFGLDSDGKLLLIDEVHTPDSSRWWDGVTYADRVADGQEPDSLDKEFVRRVFADLGYRGDGPVPRVPDEVWSETSTRYISTYERLTGVPFQPGAYPVPERLINTLHTAGLI